MARTSRARSADDAKLRLTSPLREKLKALVFDANAYGQARPDLDHLGRLASRLAGIHVETWVPEPVAWEWAEHLASDWQVLKNAAAAERKRLLDAGLEVPAPTGYATRDEVIAAALANLANTPNVKIIELSGRSAIEGLKDQVLLRDPAKRKGGRAPDPEKGIKGVTGIKTGASDSAWIRDVLALAAPDEVVIVSSDRDVSAAFEAWNKQIPELRSLTELRPTFFDFTVDDGHARSAIVRYLRERIPAQVERDGIDIGRIVGLEAAYTATRDGDGTSLSSYGASVTGLVALAGIGSVRVEANQPSAPTPNNRGNGPADPGTALMEAADATVFFLATGEATVQTLLNGGDPEVEVVPINSVLVRAQLTFQFVDGVITSLAADTDATAMILEEAFDDDEALAEAVIEALNTVPGIALDSGPLEDQVIDIPGTKAHVALSTSRFGDGQWAMEINLWLGNDEEQELEGTAGVECEYDPSSWWGGREGFQGPDAYPVSVWGTGLHDTHKVWALSAWLIDRIDWPQFLVLTPEPVAATNDESADD
ncbi:hypothetical protein GCM10017744_102390 [Streptomyces antimycoticus]|uniref:Uncharacterized protein n=1 Tax=Streptomyces antimycoticus TaxID=68175 RepID=A0A4D4KL74_9ACTN|nr:hypothetical protein [Streptomyces antimycoticus]GDY49272.1 hypothetical protein SANT12839_101540 [Streptomyces antimycoticus]